MSGSQKHSYICKYNNLPTTCFGLIRPSSGWNTASEENYLSDLKAGVQGRGRDLVYNVNKYMDTICALCRKYTELMHKEKVTSFGKCRL